MSGRAGAWLPLIALAVLGCNPSTPKEAITTDGTAASTTRATTSDGGGNTTAHDASARALVMLEATQDTDALSLIRTKRLEAKADGRVLVVYVGATWCEPCKRFKAEVSRGRLDDRLGALTLLAFDVDRDGDRLAAAGYSYRFVPFVALPGADGRPIETLQATGKGGEAWRELLGELSRWQDGAIR